jgi:predicted heme/steroid binding protein
MEAAPAPAPEPAPAPAPAPAPVEVAAPAPAPAAPAPIVFGWEGLVDAYYLYNFTGDPKNQGPAYRQFDTNANSFTLNYAKLGVHADSELVTLRMDLGVGHAASVINGASLLASGGGGTGEEASLYGNGLFVQQAYAQVRPEAHISIDAGRFVTSAGAEVIESNKNWLYSRSLMFYGIPLLHTGLRINLAALGTIAAPELVISLQLVNGWNNDPDNNSDKTYVINAVYTPPNMGLTVAGGAHIGKEVAGTDTRILVDAVVLKDIGNVSVGANIDYFKLGSANWFGVAAMGRFILSDAFNLAARAEYLKSKNGAYIPVDGALYEFSGQAAWTVDKHYELRFEVRADMSDKEVFVKGTTPKKNQVTGLVAALAYF